jgi:hypothetical protein
LKKIKLLRSSGSINQNIPEEKKNNDEFNIGNASEVGYRKGESKYDPR